MRIGFDVSQTGQYKAGCGYFADGLIRKLVAERDSDFYILYPAMGDVFWDPSCGRSTFQCRSRNCKRLKAPRHFDSSKRFWLHPGGDFEAAIGNPDIVHANSFFCPRGMSRARLVYTLYDLSFLREPGWATETMRVGCFDGVFRASVSADWVVCISEFSRRDFHSIFPAYPYERLSVVYPASRFETVGQPVRPRRARGLETGKFWLSVGTIEPRKNYARLFEAYHILKEQSGPVFPLAVAGSRGWLIDKGGSLAEALDSDRDILELGYVSDEELRWLYENCFATVYPSYFEGFGMPVLEALGCGSPVLCSSEGALPEAGGNAALYFDPKSAGSIADAMSRLLRGEIQRELLRQRGWEHASRFSWSRSAAQVSEVYRDVLQLPARVNLR